MNKIPYPSQNTQAKNLPVDVCIFGRFGWLSPAAVHSADCQFDSRVKWWIYASLIVIYLCKNFLLHWNCCKKNALNHWYLVFDWLSQYCTDFEHGFFIDKCSYKIVNTLPSDIINFSTISSNFSLRLAKTSLEFFMFSRTTAKFGWPEHSTSFVSVWPCLKSAYHLLTVVSDGAESK